MGCTSSKTVQMEREAQDLPTLLAQPDVKQDGIALASTAPSSQGVEVEEVHIEDTSAARATTCCFATRAHEAIQEDIIEEKDDVPEACEAEDVDAKTPSAKFLEAVAGLWTPRAPEGSPMASSGGDAPAADDSSSKETATSPAVADAAEAGAKTPSAKIFEAVSGMFTPRAPENSPPPEASTEAPAAEAVAEAAEADAKTQSSKFLEAVSGMFTPRARESNPPPEACTEAAVEDKEVAGEAAPAPKNLMETVSALWTPRAPPPAPVAEAAAETAAAEDSEAQIIEGESAAKATGCAWANSSSKAVEPVQEESKAEADATTSALETSPPPAPSSGSAAWMWRANWFRKQDDAPEAQVDLADARSTDAGVSETVADAQPASSTLFCSSWKRPEEQRQVEEIDVSDEKDEEPKVTVETDNRAANMGCLWGSKAPAADVAPDADSMAIDTKAMEASAASVEETAQSDEQALQKKGCLGF